MKRTKEFVVKVPKQSPRIVAISSIKNSQVIAYGNDAKTVVRKAKKTKKSNRRQPVILHVPKPDETYIY